MYTSLVSRSLSSRSKLSTKGSSQILVAASNRPWNDEYKNLSDGGDGLILTDITGGTQYSVEKDYPKVPKNAISIRNEVEIFKT